MNAIEIEHLHKAYGSISVLRDLSLSIRQGEVYALMGAHGTGKSTLIHILLGFLKPSRGKVRILGMRDLDAARQRIGYIPERMNYHTRYSAREYLHFLGRFSDMSGSTLRRRVEEQLRRVGLLDVADRQLAAFSKGMLQRFGVAQALLSDPELILMDDPLSVLDTADQRELIDLLAEVRKHGYTILVCSHCVPFLVHFCDRIGVLAGGHLVDEADVGHLRTTSTSVKIRVDLLPPVVRIQLTNLSEAVECATHTITLRPNTQQLQAQVLRILLDGGVSILSLEPLEHPLEHFYLQAAGRVATPPPAPVPMVHDAPGDASDEQARYDAEYPGDDPLLNSLLLNMRDKEHR